MGTPKRSVTAQAVLAERAVLTDMGVLDDQLARNMLQPSMARIYWLAKHLPYSVRARSVTLAGLAARVMWFDNQVTSAMDEGIEQIVVIGAGYDSRAWRLQRKGVQFFELDHAASQQDKVKRAPAEGPTYVEADLATENAGAALQSCGLDSARPAMFVVEGVTMYLSEENVRRLLVDLGVSSARGSRLAIDFYPPQDRGTSVNKRQRRLQKLARVGGDEKFRLCLDPTQAVSLVEETSWEVTEATNCRKAAQVLVPTSSRLRVDSINEHKTQIAGLHR